MKEPTIILRETEWANIPLERCGCSGVKLKKETSFCLATEYDENMLLRINIIVRIPSPSIEYDILLDKPLPLSHFPRENAIAMEAFTHYQSPNFVYAQAVSYFVAPLSKLYIQRRGPKLETLHFEWQYNGFLAKAAIPFEAMAGWFDQT